MTPGSNLIEGLAATPVVVGECAQLAYPASFSVVIDFEPQGAEEFAILVRVIFVRNGLAVFNAFSCRDKAQAL